MLTKKQKLQLENKIYNLINEGIFEDAFTENLYYEDNDSSDDDKKDNRKTDKDSEVDTNARQMVDRWLDSAQQLHSQLAYRLWPGMDKDEARSLFSKKYRGEYAEGKTYSFNDKEIDTLYNMKDRFISKIEGYKNESCY